VNIADALRATRSRLVGVADHPSFEAELLVASVLQTERARLFARLKDPLREPARALLNRLVEQRRSGCPLSLLRGWKHFRNLTLFVSRGVFIPRYETEVLVEAALQSGSSGIALDLCTGSGPLALSLADEGSFSEVFATDISEGALSLASRNALYNNISNVSFFRGDLFDALPPGSPRFDTIVSNPPYIPTDDLDGLPRSVSDFEPRAALDGGDDGLDVIRRIIQSAPEYMRAGSALIVEIAPFQSPAVTALLRRSGFLDVRVFPDSSMQDRCVRALYPGPGTARGSFA
jgi:release factor glutamine methyltransferase